MVLEQRRHVTVGLDAGAYHYLGSIDEERMTESDVVQEKLTAHVTRKEARICGLSVLAFIPACNGPNPPRLPLLLFHAVLQLVQRASNLDRTPRLLTLIQGASA